MVFVTKVTLPKEVDETFIILRTLTKQSYSTESTSEVLRIALMQLYQQRACVGLATHVATHRGIDET